MYEKINKVRKREEGKKKEGREGGRMDQLVVENQIYTKAEERLYLFHSLIIYDLNFLPNQEKIKEVHISKKVLWGLPWWCSG